MDGSFLKLPVNYSIVTNVDYEHLDYYKNFKNLENSFINFINKTPPTGKAIICMDSINVRRIKKRKNKNIFTYGEHKDSNYRISNIKYNTDNTNFDLSFKTSQNKINKIKNINVKLLGKHNVLVAAAAFIVCNNLGADQKLLKNHLGRFSGVQRRMTKFFQENQTTF